MHNTCVICVVTVKNESWILRNFIECAKPWADLIIVGDHNSADNSGEIARQYDFVKVIGLPNPAYDEDIRKKMLIAEARKVPGKRLILSIDADEMISANWTESPEWALMLDAPPGTSFCFDWAELLPGLRQCAIHEIVAAFVDDGAEYRGAKMHSPRIPATTGETVKLKDIKLLHYIAIESARLFSRHRWYKCLEYINHDTRPWNACVTYQDTRIKTYDATIIPVKEEWLSGYAWLDEYRLRKVDAEKCYWWDEEILDYFDRYGVSKFRKLNIWDVDWNKKARLLNRIGNYSDPRSAYEVWVHKFIERHREELKLNHSFKWRAVRLFGRTVLRALGW